MNRIAIAAAALLLSFPALAGAPAGAKKDAAARAVHGKPQAPVTVTAKLGPGTATVTLRFHSAASEVSVQVHGVDGLTVTSDATPVSGGRFANGQTATFDVAFTEGPGRSQLAVAVTGRFGTGTRATVASFGVGQKSAEQEKASPPATTDSTGQRIKLMPADTR